MSSNHLVAPPSTPSRPRDTWSLFFGPWSLVVLVLLAYAPSLNAPFIFDDTGAILQNRTIRTISLAALSPPTDGSTTTGRPLVNVTFALNHAISGEAPWSYHAANLAIHLGCALLLFALVGLTINRRASVLQTPPSTCVFSPARQIAFFTALLWSLHPLQTETVICTAQRTESLCALFYLLTLYCFARSTVCHPLGDKRSARRWRILSVVSCLLGMACKEIMVTAPLVVLLFDRAFFADSFAAALRERRAYYATLAATWLLLAWLVIDNSGARGVAAGFGLGVTPWTYLLTQCDALVRYVALAVWPFPLVLDYGSATINSLTAVWWQATLVLIALATTVWTLVHHRRAGFLFALAFLLLAPSSSFVPLITQTIAEHRMYLPLAALCCGVAWFALRALGSVAPLLLAAFALLGGTITFARARLYHDPVALWSQDVAHRPHARSITALGVALLHSGHAAQSLPHFDRALALDSTHLTAQHSRALALLQLGRAAEAAPILATLPAREPGEADEFFALGNAFARDEKFAEAAAAYGRTVALDPTRVAARANLGNALLLSGRPAEAITHYEAVLRLQPNDARARENLEIAREALRAKPNR